MKNVIYDNTEIACKALRNTSDAEVIVNCTLINVQRQPITHFQSTTAAWFWSFFYSHGSSTNHRCFQHILSALTLSLYMRFKVPEYLAILSLYWTTHRLKNKIELTYRCNHVRIANLHHQIMMHSNWCMEPINKLLVNNRTASTTYFELSEPPIQCPSWSSPWGWQRCLCHLNCSKTLDSIQSKEKRGRRLRSCTLAQ